MTLIPGYTASTSQVPGLQAWATVNGYAMVFSTQWALGWLKDSEREAGFLAVPLSRRRCAWEIRPLTFVASFELSTWKEMVSLSFVRDVGHGTALDVPVLCSLGRQHPCGDLCTAPVPTCFRTNCSECRQHVGGRGAFHLTCPGHRSLEMTAQAVDMSLILA